MTANYSNGSAGGGGEVVENGGAVQTGASMMEQLVPEIRTHALSYLDYRSLCRLSMTNSTMRKAANDDNAWKSLYRKVLFVLITLWVSAVSVSFMLLGFVRDCLFIEVDYKLFLFVTELKY